MRQIVFYTLWYISCAAIIYLLTLDKAIFNVVTTVALLAVIIYGSVKICNWLVHKDTKHKDK